MTTKFIENQNKYKDYLTKHISNVNKSFAYLLDNGIVKLDPNLTILITNHDKSKRTDEEWQPYVDYFYGDLKTPEIEKAFDVAWNYHQKRNPHHWQFWVLLKDSGGIEPLEMPYNFVVEMICDWWAFSWESGNLYEIFDWYGKNKEKQLLHENTRILVEELLGKIKQSLMKKKKESEANE